MCPMEHSRTERAGPEMSSGSSSQASQEQESSIEEDSKSTSEATGSSFFQGAGCHCLEFNSFWNEGGERRYVYIRYNIAEGAFQMAIDQDSNLYHVPIAHSARTDEPATVWDLHVGAELDILGRMTTLQHCTQTTAQWNKYWADRLMSLRTKLVEELRKYDTRKTEPWLTYNKASKAAGSADLRFLMGQVAHLVAELEKYRPRLATKYAIPQEMYDIEEMPRSGLGEG